MSTITKPKRQRKSAPSDQPANFECGSHAAALDTRGAGNWPWMRLDECCYLNPSRTPVSSDDTAPFHFVPMSAVAPEFGGIDVSQTRPYGEVKKGYTQFLAGDVLFAKITPCMENGKVAVVPELSSPCGFGSTEFHVFRPKPCVLAGWVAYFLSQRSFRHEAQRNMGGSAGQLRVPGKWLGEQLVPVPPLHVQRERLAHLDELLSDLDSAVAALQRAKANLKRYLAAVLDSAINQQPSLLKYMPLRATIAEIQQGWSPKCVPCASSDPNLWAVITTTAVQPLLFDGNQNKLLPSSLVPREHLQITAGDVLVTRAGPRNRTGICCFVPEVRTRLVLCDKAYRLRVAKAVVRGDYLALVLNTPKVVRQLDTLKTGISDSGVNLTQSRLLAMEIPIPRLETQARVAEEFAQLSSVAMSLEVQVEQAIRKSVLVRHQSLNSLLSQNEELSHA